MLVGHAILIEHGYHCANKFFICSAIHCTYIHVAYLYLRYPIDYTFSRGQCDYSLSSRERYNIRSCVLRQGCCGPQNSNTSHISRLRNYQSALESRSRPGSTDAIGRSQNFHLNGPRRRVVGDGGKSTRVKRQQRAYRGDENSSPNGIPHLNLHRVCINDVSAECLPAKVGMVDDEGTNSHRVPGEVGAIIARVTVPLEGIRESMERGSSKTALVNVGERATQAAIGNAKKVVIGRGALES